jgi:hypothetical protein
MSWFLRKNDSIPITSVEWKYVREYRVDTTPNSLRFDNRRENNGCTETLVRF